MQFAGFPIHFSVLASLEKPHLKVAEKAKNVLEISNELIQFSFRAQVIYSFN